MSESSPSLSTAMSHLAVDSNVASYRSENFLTQLYANDLAKRLYPESGLYRVYFHSDAEFLTAWLDKLPAQLEHCREKVWSFEAFRSGPTTRDDWKDICRAKYQARQLRERSIEYKDILIIARSKVKEELGKVQEMLRGPRRGVEGGEAAEGVETVLKKARDSAVVAARENELTRDTFERRWYVGEVTVAYLDSHERCLKAIENLKKTEKSLAGSEN